MENFIIGGLAGVVSRTLTAPVELYRIQKQNYFMPNSTIKDVVKKEGIRYLWKGNGVNCIRVFPQYAINWGIFKLATNSTKNIIKKNEARNFICGLLSGSISTIAIYPLETIRTRLSLQTKKNHYNGLFDVFKKTPIKSLYGGLLMSIYGFAPFNALSFVFYHKLKEVFDGPNSKMICGGLSGMWAISITYPTDLIRRRLQLQNFDKFVPEYKGIVDCCVKIFKKDGMTGFYKGLGAAYFKVFPTLAIQFWTIEILTKLSKSSTNI